MENNENKNEEKVVELIETEIDFGFTQDGQSKYSQVYFVKPKLKEKVGFELTWSEGDKKYVSHTQKLQGKLIKIEQSSYVYDKETIETLKFHLEWMNKEKEPVLFIMGTSYTSAMRTLLNSLVGCKEPIEKLSLTLYENKDGYASIYTLINGKKSEWKYDWKTLNNKVTEIKHPKTGKVLQRDYTELNEFLKDELFGMIGIIIPDHRVVVPEQAADKFFKDKSDDNKSDEITEEDGADFFGDNDAKMDDDFNLDVK